MKKLFKLSATAIILAGANMLLSQSALACTQNDPHYHSCVYHNIILPQQQQQQGYGNYGGYGGYNSSANIQIDQSHLQEDCKTDTKGQKVCLTYNHKVKHIVRKAVYDKAGQRLYNVSYEDANGKMGTESFYENDKIKLFKIYRSEPYTVSTIKQYENGIMRNEKMFYDNGNLMVEYQYDENEQLLYEQNYNKQGKKHGREVFYKPYKFGSSVARKFTWKDGVKIK